MINKYNHQLVNKTNRDHQFDNLIFLIENLKKRGGDKPTF